MNMTNTNAVERAEALLTRWEQRLSPGVRPTTPDIIPSPQAQEGAVERADSALGRLGRRLSGRGLIKTAAYGYVALAIKTGRVADTVQKTWQESVEAARTQQIQQAKQAGGKSAARRTATDERKGENILKGVEKDVAQDAAKDVATAAEAAV